MTTAETVAELLRQTPAQQRVANGVHWLNQDFPQWRSIVDPNKLSMHQGSQCICGQVFRANAEKVQKQPRNKMAWGEHGYGYAVAYLFEEANSWITSFIPRAQGPAFRRDLRANYVSTFLGFVDGYGVSIRDLQALWVKELREPGSISQEYAPAL